MAIFNSYVSHYQRVIPQFETPQKKTTCIIRDICSWRKHMCVARASLPFWVDFSSLRYRNQNLSEGCLPAKLHEKILIFHL